MTLRWRDVRLGSGWGALLQSNSGWLPLWCGEARPTASVASGELLCSREHANAHAEAGRPLREALSGNVSDGARKEEEATESASRSITMLAALERLYGEDGSGLRRPGEGEGAPGSAEVRLGADEARCVEVRLLALGADAKEGRTTRELAATFTLLAVALWARWATEQVSIFLVGPNLPLEHAEGTAPEEFELVCPPAAACSDVGAAAPVAVASVSSAPRLPLSAAADTRRMLRIHCTRQLLHGAGVAQRLRGAGGKDFACAFAFNAGVWGYDSWAATINILTTPLVLTSYNELEADDDAGALEECGLCEGDWHWAAERNPFGSTKVRLNCMGREAADNQWWQCVRPPAFCLIRHQSSEGVGWLAEDHAVGGISA